MIEEIQAEDRVTYAEAVDMTQRSRRHLRKLAAAGRLSRVGGQRSDPYKTFLSRNQVEASAFQEYRRGQTGSYWMTMTQVADLTDIARANVHQARQYGRLTAHRTQLGDWLV